jgi:Ca2+-binding EF-hand superfamily protein
VLHDLDGDGQLDGMELMHAFAEWSAETWAGLPETDRSWKTMLDVAAELVDHVLTEDDLDRNGRVSIEEFLANQHY